ncbi:PIN domain-containing protein [Anaerolineales bacterium HSG6]|nr:PIN domain-containing protein [Anaerolineales bacterium HSG6]
MRISLDTNVWIFGIVGSDEFCQRILDNLSLFDVIVPDQVRRELNRNLSEQMMKRFYQFIQQPNVQLSYDEVPEIYITMFESKGLKKGDAIIGGFGEWRKVDKIVSDNRDFLRGLSAGHHFEVMSPQEFCEEFSL